MLLLTAVRGASVLVEFSAEGVHGPGWTAAAQEVVVAGEDADVEGESESDGRPVVGIAGHAAACDRLHVLVHGAGDDLDHAVFDESAIIGRK